jgi:hypothetical protein
VYLAERKQATKQSEQLAPPGPPTTVADISIKLSANGDVTYERHNLTTCTARSLMLGCYVMLGETMEVMNDA